MMHRLCRRWAGGLIAAALLSGCAFAPGSHLDYDTASAPIDDLVDIEPITFGLVRAQRDAGLATLEATPAVPELGAYDYRVGNGDVLSIIVYDHPELTIPEGSERSAAESGNTVHSDGTIFYPYIGRFEVSGQTVAEIRDRLAERLSTYIADPQVEVRVAAFNSQKVLVTGEVRQPGRQPITNVPLRVLDAVSQAGGLGETANWHEVRLTRDGEEIRLSLFDMLNQGELDENLLLQDGDILHVPDATDQRVYVMGEVNRAGALPMGRSRLTLADALADSGSLNPATGDASGIFVIRRAAPTSDKLATVYQLDARNAAAMMLGAEFELQPMDIVYVTTTGLGRWNRVISQLLPTVTAIYQTTRATRDVQDLRDDF